MTNSSVSQGKKPLLIAGTVTVSLIIVLVALELILRVLGFSPTYINPLNAFHDGDNVVGWKGRPNVAAQFRREDFNVHVEMDSGGFRAPNHEVKVAKDAVPIWFLGDSFTWGWGVEQGKVFSDHLQRLLGGGFLIVNRGVNGTGTLQQALVLESNEVELKPGYIGIMVFRNDFDDNLNPNNNSRPYYRESGDSVEIANLPVANPIGGLGREILNHSNHLQKFEAY